MTRIASHRLSVSLVTLGDPNTLTGGYLYHRRLAELAPRHGARLMFASFPAWPFPFPVLYGPRLPRVLSAEQPDVVVLDSIAAAFLAPWMAAVRAPVVAMLHQPPGGIDHGPIRRRAQAVLDRAAYRQVGRVLVASQLLADQLGGQGFAAKLLVLPPGRDPAPAAGGRQQDLRAGARAALLCVGNWVARKGILQALDAVARLPAGLVRLHLVGDERPDPRYAARVRRRLARSDLAGRVECHGRLGREEVAAMYRDADLFVLPSVREPYGTVYGEAMAAGLPVVGWRAGNLPYLAGDGREGLLAQPGDVDGLASALRALAEDGELRTRLGAAARRRAVTFPTWEQTAERFFAAVRDAAGRPAARPLPADLGWPAQQGHRRRHDRAGRHTGDARRIRDGTARRALQSAARAARQAAPDDAIARPGRGVLHRVARTVQRDRRCPHRGGQVQRAAVNANDQAGPGVQCGQPAQRKQARDPRRRPAARRSRRIDECGLARGARDQQPRPHDLTKPPRDLTPALRWPVLEWPSGARMQHHRARPGARRCQEPVRLPLVRERWPHGAGHPTGGREGWPVEQREPGGQDRVGHQRHVRAPGRRQRVGQKRPGARHGEADPYRHPGGCTQRAG
jgi:glycosyltransferase involved in cell wall biosynthesis